MNNRRAIGFAAAAAVAALAAAQPALAARRARATPDVAVTRIAVPRGVVAGVPFTVDVRLLERSRRAAASAVVTVAADAGPASRADAVRVGAGGRARVSVPV